MSSYPSGLLSSGFAYAFVHFSVEVACFYFLFSRLSADPRWWILAMLFDALAFIPQSFFGLLIDRFHKLNVGFIGCGLLFAALLIPSDIFALVVLSTGNALAHIGGAQHTLRGARGKIAPCGIFVSGGSFGVITGQLLGAAGASIFIPIALVLLSAVFALAVDLRKCESCENENSGFDVAADLSSGIVITLAFIVVAVRSYMAYAIPTEWNKTTLQAVTLFAFMGFGKMLGGILCDSIGYKKTSFISLIAALPFLLFGNSLMLLSLLGVGLFSMTMTATVAIISSKLPHNPGFSFGITTVALFAGTLPAFFLQPQSLFAHQAVVLALSALAFLCINISIKKGC